MQWTGLSRLQRPWRILGPAMLKRILAIFFLVMCLGASLSSAAFADGNNPNGGSPGATTGYEGQPGNQAPVH